MSYTAITPPATAAFAGYFASFTHQDGQTSKCRVINRNAAVKFLDGTVGAGLKISVGHISGYQGWSGGCRPVYSFGPGIWVKAERVSAEGQVAA